MTELVRPHGSDDRAQNGTGLGRESLISESCSSHGLGSLMNWYFVAVRGYHSK